MITLKVTRKHERAILPSGNAMHLSALNPTVCFNRSIAMVSTGIGFKLLPGLGLTLSSMNPELAVIGYEFRDEELIILLTAIGKSDYYIEAGEKIAIGTLVKHEVVPVRFIEMVAGGGRLVKGEPRTIEDCTKIRDTES